MINEIMDLLRYDMSLVFTEVYISVNIKIILTDFYEIRK